MVHGVSGLCFREGVFYQDKSLEHDMAHRVRFSGVNHVRHSFAAGTIGIDFKISSYLRTAPAFSVSRKYVVSLGAFVNNPHADKGR
jgi:hypothetical protein